MCDLGVILSGEIGCLTPRESKGKTSHPRSLWPPLKVSFSPTISLSHCTRWQLLHMTWWITILVNEKGLLLIKIWNLFLTSLAKQLMSNLYVRFTNQPYLETLSHDFLVFNLLGHLWEKRFWNIIHNIWHLTFRDQTSYCWLTSKKLGQCPIQHWEINDNSDPLRTSNDNLIGWIWQWLPSHVIDQINSPGNN